MASSTAVMLSHSLAATLTAQPCQTSTHTAAVRCDMRRAACTMTTTATSTAKLTPSADGMAVWRIAGG
eukprot:662103-Prymnesium_polylepis.1